MFGPHFPSFTSLGLIRIVESSWAIIFLRIGECPEGGGVGGDYNKLVPNFKKIPLSNLKNLKL